MATPIPILASTVRPSGKLLAVGRLMLVAAAVPVVLVVAPAAAMAEVEEPIEAELVPVEEPVEEVLEEIVAAVAVVPTVLVCPLPKFVMLKKLLFESLVDFPSSKMLRKKRLDAVKSLAVATIQVNSEMPTAFPVNRHQSSVGIIRLGDNR